MIINHLVIIILTLNTGLNMAHCSAAPRHTTSFAFRVRLAPCTFRGTAQAVHVHHAAAVPSPWVSRGAAGTVHMQRGSHRETLRTGSWWMLSWAVHKQREAHRTQQLVNAMMGGAHAGGRLIGQAVLECNHGQCTSRETHRTQAACEAMNPEM